MSVGRVNETMSWGNIYICIYEYKLTSFADVLPAKKGKSVQTRDATTKRNFIIPLLGQAHGHSQLIKSGKVSLPNERISKEHRRIFWSVGRRWILAFSTWEKSKITLTITVYINWSLLSIRATLKETILKQNVSTSAPQELIPSWSQFEGLGVWC